MRIYRNALQNFRRICGDRPIGNYKRSDIQDYKLQRLEENIKKTTINIEMRSIKAGFSWAEKNEYLLKSAFKGQDFMFDMGQKREEFKKAQLDRLFKHTEGAMIGTAIRLSYYTGMRVSEVSNLRWNMVNIEQKLLILPAELMKQKKPHTFRLVIKLLISSKYCA